MAHTRKISVIGLGFVGLALVVAFSKNNKVIAYDTNAKRIADLKTGLDQSEEVSPEEINQANIHFTTNADDLSGADFYIVCVPTPIDANSLPCFKMLSDASETIGKRLKKNDIVVYESTVYPGATEQDCIPILEKASHLKCGKDFFVGYSPERINPGDTQHQINNITKIISATDKKTLEIMNAVYKNIIQEVFPVSSIRVAEATKVIENTQRDINIAFMNDIAIMLHAMEIDTAEVLNAMKTKWNYIPFQPGLVGGHCIGVNSYYLLYQAEKYGYHSDLIALGRRINENISKFIADETIKKLIALNIQVKEARIAILGLTYKENCSDVKDTGVIEVINALRAYGPEILVHDPIADPEMAKKEYGFELQKWENLTNIDAIILTVKHREYLKMKDKIIKILKNQGLIMDIKELFDLKDLQDTKIILWRL